ncbi:Major facilitator superfamily MFS_1 [Nostocoides japonicum T1-X7]|uniref:Major facilitator superfamily MFS_1 n=1 Tax=Nostocoides japonicum T1-X7 TaxID=1194083 RepID=A0A077M291_9MICO|nr:MFS transporter [Tetrasphaera japonica]CCH78325.1 Major facilitator superfamily MFS_1 [Tetrasphaera japonica T1-X7]
MFVSRIVDVAFPPRMGAAFRWLFGSNLVSNLGDGVALAAGPLLVATQTHSAFLVALAGLLQRLPWLLLGLYAGAVADRIDRKLLVMGADAARALVVLVLAVTIATGWVDITVVLVTMFVFGIGEVFADSASMTLLPMLLDKDDLGIGNARMQAGNLTANQLIGPPIGAFLFATGMVIPFLAQAVCVAFGVVLMGRVAVPRGSVRPDVRSHIRHDIAEGLRWLTQHAAMRTLAIVILVFNVTWGAAWSVLVLYSLDRLHMGEVGFGLLTTATAAGGVAATLGYGWLERHVALSTLMRACLTLEVATHLSLAVTTTGWVAVVIMVVFGGYAFVWGTLSSRVRQRVVPTELQGRVTSVYVVGLFAGLVVGQALGGVIAEHWGLAAPFWFAFVGSGITLALVWRQLAHISAADAAATA